MQGAIHTRDYIITYTGKKFTPMEPVCEDIDILDIAHSQAYMTRANGHTHFFYSVGQHSVNCAKEAMARGYSRRVQLACLLHDGSESYLSDITRPVKKHLPQYRTIEAKLSAAVYKRFGLYPLTAQEVDQVAEVDDCLLYHEFIVLKNVRLEGVPPILHAKLELIQLPFNQVEREMLALYEELRLDAPQKP